jgi:hypothetical protein
MRGREKRWLPDDVNDRRDALGGGRYPARNRSREAFREYFRENEVLLAVLLAAADDIDPVDGIAAVDADPDNISDILGNLDDTLEEVQQDDILENIVEDIQFPSGEDTA